MVCLHMGLEDGSNRGVETVGLREVGLHEIGVRVDDGELAVREAAEQIARTRRGLK